MKRKIKIISKKIIACMLCMVMSGTALELVPSLSAFAATGYADYVYVEVQRHFVKLDPINDEEAEITGFYEMPSYGYIPETMEGYKIVGIGNSAFWCCDSIYGLRLPDTIRYIDKYAFGHCGNLSEINIPDSVHYIGDSAFNECTSLEGIDLPDSITAIGEGAFKLCSNLRSFTFPKGVTEISDNVLSFNNSLETINIHSGIKKIGNFSFRDNPVIESLYIPDSVEEIGEEAFTNCTKLKNVRLPEGWSEISDYMFYGCSSLESFEIKDSVTRIGKGAFYKCPNLKSLTVPDSVTDIGERAIGYVEGVPDWTYAKVDGFTIYGSYGSAAEKYAAENEIAFIGSSPYDYKTNDEGTLTITGYHGNSKNLVIPSEINNVAVTQIADFAFSETDIESVVIPDCVNRIGGCVFESCKSLKSVTLPSNLRIFNEELTGGQFRECVSLESIVLPSSLEALGPFTFADCEKLCSVNVPESIKSMGAGVFENTGWQRSQPEGLLYFGNILCGYNGKIHENLSLTVRGGTKHISAGALASDNNPNIVSIILPEGLETIDGLGIFNCTNLKEITIPSTVVSIGNCALGYYYDRAEDKFNRIDSLVICGKPGTAAESYAKDNGFRFVDSTQLNNKSSISSESVPVNTAVTVSGKASGGKGSYRFAYYYKKSTDSSWTKIVTENNTAYVTAESVTFRPAVSGTYTIRVNVKDSTNSIVQKNFTLTVKPALKNISSVSSADVPVNTAVTVKGKASGGSEPYRYAYYYKKSTDSSWTKIVKGDNTAYVTNETVTFKPTVSGIYTIRVNVKDSTDKVVTKEFTLKVRQELKNISSVSSANVPVDTSLTITGKASGGSEPYRYAYYYRKSTDSSWTKIVKGDNTAYVTDETVTFKATAAGIYTVRVNVKDSTDKAAVKDFTLTVK